MNLAQRVTRAMGGNWYGHYGTVPAPGHSRKDRSVSVQPHRSDSEDVFITAFAGEDPLAIKAEWRRQGILPERFRPSASQGFRNPSTSGSRAAESHEEVLERLELARWLWRRSQPIAGTLGERYLREKRHITIPLPATLRFLPAAGKHPASLIGAFGLPEEPEPGVLQVNNLRGIHLTKLRADGLEKASVEPNKVMLGRGHTLPIVLAPVNDLGGLVITEGIEEALAVREVWGVGVWAAGSASRLPSLAEHVPAYVECVTVLIDPDPAGARFGNRLVELLKQRGLEVLAIPVQGFEAAVLRLREACHGR
jgi:hypothetical protein